MRARLIPVLVATCALFVSHVAPAVARGMREGRGWASSDGLVAEVRTSPAASVEPGGRRRARPVCTYEFLTDTALTMPDRSELPPPGEGAWYVQRCRDREGTEFAWSIVYRERGLPPEVDPAAMALEALDRVALPLPVPAMSPDPDRLLVHVPTWLWLEGGWRPVSASASVPGVTVTVTAEPEAVTWDMGNGDEVVCRGPGTPYDRSRPADEQSTDCSYTYRRSSAGHSGDRFVVTATMRWHVTWTVTGLPGGGDLGGVTRSTSMDVRVAEGQALVGQGRA